MTADGLASRLDREPVSSPARLPASGAGSRYGLTSRRRRSDVHRIVASTLAVLALVGCVTAVLVLAIAPTATRLQEDVGSLNARLAVTENQLAALQRLTAHTAARGSRLTKSIGLLRHHMAGLQRTVHGLRGSSTLTREQTAGMSACFGELQQELSGLVLRTRSAHGHVTSVGLTRTAAPSAACGAAFSGG